MYKNRSIILFIVCIIVVITSRPSESSHIHLETLSNGTQLYCYEEELLVDTRGCPSNMFYDPQICTGVLLLESGTVWTKEIYNVSLGIKMGIDLVVGLGYFEDEKLLEFQYNVTIIAKNAMEDQWSVLLDDSTDSIANCPQRASYCNRNTLLEQAKTSFSMYSITFTFRNLSDEFRNDIANVLFNFRFTNCTNSNSTTIQVNTSSSSGIILSIGSILAVIVLSGLVFGFFAYKYVQYKKKQMNEDSNNNNRSIDFSDNELETFSLLPKEEAFIQAPLFNHYIDIELPQPQPQQQEIEEEEGSLTQNLYNDVRQNPLSIQSN